MVKATEMGLWNGKQKQPFTLSLLVVFGRFNLDGSKEVFAWYKGEILIVIP